MRRSICRRRKASWRRSSSDARNRSHSAEPIAAANWKMRYREQEPLRIKLGEAFATAKMLDEQIASLESELRDAGSEVGPMLQALGGTDQQAGVSSGRGQIRINRRKPRPRHTWSNSASDCLRPNGDWSKCGASSRGPMRSTAAWMPSSRGFASGSPCFPSWKVDWKVSTAACRKFYESRARIPTQAVRRGARRGRRSVSRRRRFGAVRGSGAWRAGPIHRDGVATIA